MRGTLELVSVFVVALGFQLQLKAWARDMGLVDVPMGRKLHAAITPLTGGLAIFAAFALAIVLEPSLRPAMLWPLVGLALLVGCGTIDDLLHLPPGHKLIAQTAAALLLLAPGNAQVASVGLLPIVDGLVTGPLAWPLSAVFIVGLINAFNMIDGLDGLAAGLAVIAFGWLTVLATAGAAGPATVLPIIGAALAATCSVLVLNMRHPWRDKASVFLGDAGSMFLGALLAWLMLRMTHPEPTAVPMVVMLWILAVPLCDAGSVILRRIRRGANPMRADGTHLHHVLRAAGLTVEQSVATILLASFAVGAMGVAGWLMEVPMWWLAGGLVFPVAGHCAAVMAIARPRTWHADEATGSAAMGEPNAP